MVASSSMDGESVGLLRDYVNELLQCVPYESDAMPNADDARRWMVKERNRIFVPEYESASIAYQNISRS